MKSSTLRRSNLSKERMLVLEELAKNKQRPYDASPGVYVRPNKDRELDVLWQNFKVTQKEDKSPGIYLVTGFIAGAIAMLIMTTLLSFSVRGTDSPEVVPAPTAAESAKLTFIPADQSSGTAVVVNAPETYVVKKGDTLAGIVVRTYGRYDLGKVENIRVANNMRNVHDLKIGQKLTLPMD